MIDEAEKALRFYDRLGESPDTTECWPWPGTVNPVTGYGVLWIRRHSFYAHRLSYEIAKGPIPAGLEIDHLCRNRRCVNPTHLEAVTHSENVRRGALPRIAAAANLAKTHCKNGHELVPPNISLYQPKPGILHRHCLACRRQNQRRYLQRMETRRAG